MWVTLCLLLVAACTVADDSENRRSKLPYVADAVGNTLPPPSNVPATVGSPVNLLTPDRYEFYTFDESGELVKRLMTLEEIQAIVAAGEEAEGLVTFANDNQPTIAFNFSQPPYTKVHNVVTNVQNVLKAQMEAHKNKPLVQPTLDTPDVSDSWSLILPSIFGNTGVDIVPDKSSGTFTTPETETIELDHPIDDNSLSKEGSNQILSSASTAANNELEENPTTPNLDTTTEQVKVIPTTTTTKPTTTTTSKPTIKSSTTTTTTTTTTMKPTTTSTTTTTAKPTTTTTTTTKPTTTSTTTTTSRPTVITTTTTKPRITTTRRSQSTSTTTSKDRNTATTTTTQIPTTKANIRSTLKPTTIKPNFTTKKPVTGSTQKDHEGNFTRVQTVPPTIYTTEKTTVEYEKISTFIPVSTVTYITERTTQRPQSTTKSTGFVSTTKRSVPTTTKSISTRIQPPATVTTDKPLSSSLDYNIISTLKHEELEKVNTTTVTTQSVSPSTTVSSVEFVTIQNNNHITGNKQPFSNGNIEDIKENEQDIPLFDVAQSISQIASDLGGSYRPIPTTSELIDTTKTNNVNLESKENFEMEIPVEKDTEIKNNNTTTELTDNFVKISTLVPHGQNNINETEIDRMKPAGTVIKNSKEPTSETKIKITPPNTTIDPVLSESMDDLLSQVVNQAPQSIVLSEKPSQIKTTEKVSENIFIENLSRVDTTTSTPPVKNIFKTSTKAPTTDSQIESENNVNSPLSSQINLVSTENPKESKPINHLDHGDIKEDKTQQNLKESVMNDFVKISEPEILSEFIFTTTYKPETNEIKANTPDLFHTNESNQEIKMNSTEESKKPAETENKNDTEFISVALNSNVSSTFKPDTTISQLNLNKVTSSENNKVNNKNEKYEISETFPKIDEFKKKIQKVNIDDKEFDNERNNTWKLISTVTPPKTNEISKDNHKADSHENTDNKHIILDYSKENQGLEVTSKDLGEDIAQFTELCNELAFRYWHTMLESIDKKRSFVLSPYSITSMLAMMFMGARGATSGEMNEILKLDDMVTFNPHFTLKNISDSIETSPESGVMVSVFARELFSDKSKGKILTFYKERAQHFYNGHVEEVNFKLISDIIRRRTNLLVKRYSWGRIVEYMKANTITMQPPLAAFSTNIFQTDCSGSSVEGRDGEMYFVVSPNVRQRRLVPVPAVVYRHGFLAGYDPVLDATAAALGKTDSIVSTLFVMPGQQGNIVHAEDLEALEKRLLNSKPTTPAWHRLLRTLLPRIGLELQIPRFSHKSIFNISSTLKMMGLKDIFDPEHADLGGLNGPSKDLYLSDMIQSTSFVTCGEGVIGDQHHIEEYPENLGGPQRRRTSRWATGWDEPRDYQRAFHDPHDVSEAMHLPLHLRPRQARLPARDAQPARLKFDRPFLYFVRHNPSGMILYVGRYNPRLLP